MQTAKMTVIRSMEDSEARRNRVMELYQLCLVEMLIDLISVAARSDQIWGKEYDFHFRNQGFVRAIIKAANDSSKELAGTDGYEKLTAKLGENRWSLKEYGVQEGWFQPKGKRENPWNDVARQLWQSAIDCVEGIGSQYIK